MHGLLRCNINTGVHAHVRRVDVSLRDITIARDGNGATRCEWRHTLEARGGFGEILKKSVESRTGHWTRWLTFACSRRPWAGAVRDGGGRWKSQDRKIVPLSPYVKEPLNSKVIKSFVPEQRSRYMFFEFRDSYVLSLWTFDVRFTHSHIGLWYTISVLDMTLNYLMVRHQPWKHGVYFFPSLLIAFCWSLPKTQIPHLLT